MFLSPQNWNLLPKGVSGFPWSQASQSWPSVPHLYSGWILTHASAVFRTEALRQTEALLFLLKPLVPPSRQNWTWKVFLKIQSKEGPFVIQVSFSGHLRPSWNSSITSGCFEAKIGLSKITSFLMWPLRKPPSLSHCRSILNRFPRQPYLSNKWKSCACMSVIMNTYICMFAVWGPCLCCSQRGIFHSTYTAPNIDRGLFHIRYRFWSTWSMVLLVSVEW